MRLKWIFVALLQLHCVAAFADGVQSSIDPSHLPAAKLTPQMKYITSQEAYEILSADPGILFIDVRDPVEFTLSGHPSPIDAIVPIRAQGTVFDEELKEWALEDNPNFLKHMKEALNRFGKTKHDMIIVTCGSGRRSAMAARTLFAAGYTDVWHIPDGYPGAEKRGLNSANAWKREGLPWSYDPVYGSNRLSVIR